MSGPTRERILAEALPLFARNGYLGVSMRHLAEACELTKPALYHHFADKESLFLALLEDGLDELEQRLAPMASLPPDATRLEALVATLCDLPERCRQLMVLSERDLSQVSAPGREHFVHRWRTGFAERVAELLAPLPLAPEFDPATAASALLALLHPLQRLPSDEARTRGLAVARLFLHGALRDPG